MCYSKSYKNNKGNYIEIWSLEKDRYCFQCKYNYKTGVLSVDCPSIGKPPKTAIAKPRDFKLIANFIAAEIIKYDK